MSIGKIVYDYGRIYICDGCPNGCGKFRSYEAAKKAGWAIGRGRRTCFCPKCAPRHRHVGRGSTTGEHTANGG